MHFASSVHPTSTTQDEASGSYPLLPVNPSSLSGPGDLPVSDPTSDVVDRFSHLKLPPTHKYIDPANPDRAQKLKALPGCQDVKDGIRQSIEQWGKSFELTEQELLFEDLEPVEALKKKTNSDLIQKQFEAVAHFSRSVKSCFAEFRELRKPFDDLVSAKDMTVTQQVEAAFQFREELEQNATKLSKNANIILDSRADVWKFQKTSVEKTRNKIQSILRAEHDQQEDIQFALDLLKDGERIAPKVKEPSGLVAASLEGVAKYGLLKVATRHKNKMLESRMLQERHRGEKSKVEALNQKLDESRNSLFDAFWSWSTFNERIYTNTILVFDRSDYGNGKVPFLAIAEELDETEGKLLTLIELIEDFLAQITQNYGSKFGTREVKRLCSRVPNIFVALEMLLSAKEVVVKDHRHIYEEHIYELCKAILEHLNHMKEVYWECRSAVNAGRRATILNNGVPKFEDGVIPHLEAIKDIAQAHISKAKSQEAYQKREKEDRYHGDIALTRPGRSLVTGDEIVWALYKVIDALLLVQLVSKASNTQSKREDVSNTEGTDGVEDGATNGAAEAVASESPEWLRMPDEMVNQFYAVLFAEAGKLQFLMDKGERHINDQRLNSSEEPETGGRLSRLIRLMTRKPH